MMESHGVHRHSARAGRRRMDFVAVVDQVIALLRQRGRVTYRTLQVRSRSMTRTWRR